MLIALAVGDSNPVAAVGKHGSDRAAKDSDAVLGS